MFGTKQFAYQGIDKNNMHETMGIIPANSLRDARLYLLDKNILPYRLRLKRKSLIEKLKYQSKTLWQLRFNEKMHLFLSAGITLITALKHLTVAEIDSGRKQILQTICSDLHQGLSLSEALQKHPRYFNHFYCMLIKVGEMTGSLENMFMRLYQHQKMWEDMRADLKRALWYPSVVITVAMLVMSILMIYVIPQFQQMYANFQATLPWFTYFVLCIANGVKTYSGFALLMCVGISFYIVRCYQKSKSFRVRMQTFILVLPIVGKIYYQSTLLRFTENLNVFYNAGIPLLASLTELAQLQNVEIFKERCSRVCEAVNRGETLTHAMTHATILPALELQLLAVGEETGSLATVFGKLSVLQKQALEKSLASLTQWIEPLLILFLGIFIGGMVIAMYLPIFSLGSLF